MEKHNTFKLFADIVKTRYKYLQYKKLKVTQWNIFEIGEKDLVIVSLRDSDGKDDYCITLLGEWIYDSSIQKALPLCKEVLDICCSSDERRE